MDAVAVLIPCRDEARTIGKVVADWRRSLPRATIYVYDNGSTDGTPDVAREAGAVVRFEPRVGKGNVVRRMFREVDAEVYVLVDGDDTYPAEAGPRMVDAVRGGADMVVGDRLSTTYGEENGRLFHGFGNGLVRFSISLIFGCRVADAMTGLRAFSRAFVKTFPILSGGFQVETEMTIHAVDKRLSVVSIPVDYRDRPSGSESKLRTIPDGIRVMFTILNMTRDYRPMLFFGALGASLLLLGISFFVPVWFEYLVTGLVARFPTLIVCGFSVLAGIQSFFTGAVLHTLRRTDLRDFEVRYLAESASAGRE